MNHLLNYITGQGRRAAGLFRFFDLDGVTSKGHLVIPVHGITSLLLIGFCGEDSHSTRTGHNGVARGGGTVRLWTRSNA